jgi:hypothetical protein
LYVNTRIAKIFFKEMIRQTRRMRPNIQGSVSFSLWRSLAHLADKSSVAAEPLWVIRVSQRHQSNAAVSTI